MKIAVVGATGLVGTVMLKVLEETNFPVTELLPVASEKSIGKEIDFKGKKVKVISVQDAINKKPHIALFSAGATASKNYAPEFAKVGTYVVDNSSAFRMDEDKKLVVPEVNKHVLTPNDRIIANPNCSTIQMVVALKPLHEKYRIKRIVVSTYQAVTGTGVKAVRQLENERNGIQGDMAYHHIIDKNCIPHCDVFIENSYTKEEMKLVNETRKILDDYSIVISPTAVRVPVVGGHSESVNVEFHNEFVTEDVFRILREAEGIIVQDDIMKNIYPMARFAEGRNEVFVGRIRRDISQPKTLNFWVVADNLRKGAATNAVQIAQYIRKFIE